ncbi:uncharacterized protein LOC111579657 isoform X2 [Amphiprion ocellaris]|uniref:uncharacterized protein LOC111579657 isoform X2 n=1 Tax=Amphiprion ocellaris TaxID=80972 RepID=UPI002410F223|nr:uncharacterized protein LOC111579657 isoform X2 [Amphiprion ocellaris]
MAAGQSETLVVCDELRTFQQSWEEEFAFVEMVQACRQLDGLGQDLVAMCVNDVLAQAVEPLFFLRDFTCIRLDIDVAASVVSGIAKACEKAGCALLGEVFLTPTKINSRLLLLRILWICQSLRSHHWWGDSGEHPLGDAPGAASGFRCFS